MDEGLTLDGYVVDELIGFGGTGEVWRARDITSNEVVALKRLRTRSDTSTERLRREAALLAAVAGPHVIGARGLVVEGDEAVLVMDYAAGGSLAGVIGVRGRLPAAEVVTVLAPVASALAAAHARDLVHGDLTPANILFTADGRPLLADFGLAQALGVIPQLVEGTADYVDPAVAAGGRLTAASDVFALGVVGFTALAGGSPWGDGPSEAVLARAAAGNRPSLAVEALGTPPGLIAIVEAMLHVDPEERPDARSVAAAVLRSSAAAPVGLVHTPAPVAPPRTEQVVPSYVLGEIDDDDEELEVARRDRAARLRRGLLIAAAAVIAVVIAAAVGVGSTHLGRGGGRAIAAVAPTPTRSPRPSPSASAAPTRLAAPAPQPSSWTAVVTALDRARARAFATGQAAALAAVYVPGSSAYSADLSTVSSLASRGLRARGFGSTVQRVTPMSGTPRTERLRVVDRLSGYSLVTASGAVEGSGAARPARAFTMTLASVDGQWRIAAITPA
jgi:hypothetical protein